ncbi:MAG: LysE family translocator [Hyphomicrobiales bacterium]|nr:LysE family translocator [Hyphomicrobiales bacterium]MDE2016691.1 LysE family translocator [Hyphomicrobiales bacterium]
MDFIPSPATLAGYTLACVVLALTPGPDMTLFLARTVSGGRAHGFAAMLGAATGLVFHATIAALGVSALIAASPSAFGVLKVGGALYLLWLGFNAIRHGAALRVGGPEAPGTARGAYLAGVAINLTNPKVILFFIGFLPQFVTAGEPHAAAKLAFLGAWFWIIGMALSACIILVAERFIAAMRGNPRAMRAFDYCFAGLMGAFALRLVTATAR